MTRGAVTTKIYMGRRVGPETKEGSVMKRKIASILLAVVICIAFVPTFAFADVPDDVQKDAAAEDDYPVELFEDYDITHYNFNLSQTKLFYNGKVQLPEVSCEELLVEDKDYYLTYDCWESDWPYDVGTYYVTITGIAPYTGAVVLKYTVVQTEITVNKTSVTLYRKGAFQLKVNVKEPNGETTYKSSNPKVATVSAGGKIIAKTKGTATITAENGYASETVKVKVKNPYLNKSKLTLKKKKKAQLKVKGLIGKATFKSSNTKIAKVSKTGKITAKKKGTCTVKVKANGITLKCKVKVK